MEAIEKAIEAAYQAEIINLYKVFFDGMLTAKDNESMGKDVQERFKAGLERAAVIHSKARALAGV